MEKQKIQSYQDLVVWQKAKDLVVYVYKITNTFPKSETFGITSQIRRATVSIPSNIAEGFRRGSQKEKVQFLRTAYGSGAEVETQLIISKELGYINETDYKKLYRILDEVMRMLNKIVNNFLK